MERLLLAAVFLSACGSGGSGASKESRNCAMQIVVNGQAPVSAPCLAGATSGGVNSVNLLLSTVNPVLESVVVNLYPPSAPRQGVYALGDMRRYHAFIEMKALGPRWWLNQPDPGTLQVTIASLELIDSKPGLDSFAIHGTLSISLRPMENSGASGDASITASF
jgi:hypothetical protein